MNTEARLINGLKSIVSIVEPNRYVGAEKTYIVFRYDSRAGVLAEGTAGAVTDSVTLDLFLPHGKSPVSYKRRIATALVTLGATYPSITNASDEDGQHFVFECEMVSENG